ncbi:ABC transporter ATP-binding protein [Leucobacter sp. UCMA 4100]|uniref:ABC transporter ATP-binding protein n=1 Tax=Leucobacter sp. UCMA 4100 TaxID=2810534 RepID=UPI0022EB8DEE|nr:ABC transporter ATP-binding protein [Leucobacter sp. UCMA 4100]MDA3146562.1 ABC transporter ATP-binding protein [Leucobacter sp. UCMA 4100]
MTATYTQQIATAAEQTGAAIRIKNVTKRYGEHTVLDEVSLDINAGEFITLLGASGSGKSTLLNIIAGFTKADGGKIEVDGVDITRTPPHNRGLGMVFQQYALFPHMTVFENVAFGLRRQRVAKEEIIERVNSVLDLIQMRHLADRRPDQLSGGQQQRVALARGIVFQPRVLLMDEPLGALDKMLREELQLEIRNIHYELGITFIFVTHDQHEALTMSDRIALLRGGSIVQLDDPKTLYQAPTSRYAAEFIGESNLLTGTVQGDVFAHAEGGEHFRVPEGGGETILIRPEHMRVETADRYTPIAGRDSVEAVVQDTVFIGTDMIVYGQTAGRKRLIARAPVSSETQGVVFGAKVVFSWDAAHARLIKED